MVPFKFSRSLRKCSSRWCLILEGVGGEEEVRTFVLMLVVSLRLKCQIRKNELSESVQLRGLNACQGR